MCIFIALLCIAFFFENYNLCTEAFVFFSKKTKNNPEKGARKKFTSPSENSCFLPLSYKKITFEVLESQLVLIMCLYNTITIEAYIFKNIKYFER